MILYVIIFLIVWFLLFKSLNVRIVLPFAYQKLSYNFEVQSYKRFVEYLSAYNPKGSTPSYKFFSIIIEELEKYQRKFGVSIDDSKREIRKAVQRDRREAKKITEQLYGLAFQYLFICAFTWIFIINMEFTLNLNFNLIHKGLLLGWQVFGFVFISVAFLFMKKYIFRNFISYFFCIYVFKSLISMSIPVSEVILFSRFSELNDEKELCLLRDRLTYLITQLKQNGYLPVGEFDNMSAELWDIYDSKIMQFSRVILVLKMASILFFVLPGFLFGIYLSMNQLIGP